MGKIRLKTVDCWLRCGAVRTPWERRLVGIENVSERDGGKEGECAKCEKREDLIVRDQFGTEAENHSQWS